MNPSHRIAEYRNEEYAACAPGSESPSPTWRCISEYRNLYEQHQKARHHALMEALKGSDPEQMGIPENWKDNMALSRFLRESEYRIFSVSSNRMRGMVNDLDLTVSSSLPIDQSSVESRACIGLLRSRHVVLFRSFSPPNHAEISKGPEIGRLSIWGGSRVSWKVRTDSRLSAPFYRSVPFQFPVSGVQ